MNTQIASNMIYHKLSHHAASYALSGKKLTSCYVRIVFSSSGKYRKNMKDWCICTPEHFTYDSRGVWHIVCAMLLSNYMWDAV